MTGTVLVCTDGSDLSIRALAAGLDLLGRDRPVTVVTVVEPPDPTLITGTGFAGGTMSAETFDEVQRQRQHEGEETVRHVAQVLGVPDAPTRVLWGAPGPALCHLAESESARAIVIGSRGRGGFRRALLGSVSDHVVRHAPCPVVVTSAVDGDGG